MKKLIKFPNEYLGNGKIGAIHYKFAKYLLSEIKEFEIETFDSSLDIWPSFKINDKIIMFDYQDFKSLNENYNNVDICLKTQYTSDLENIDNVFPWSQVSFLDWSYFHNLRSLINYKAKGNLIINNQKPYGNAKQRRLKVKNLLQSTYRNNVSTKPDMNQTKFFKQINDCLVYVHVPGYSNNMLDRAHVQMFAFGCCVITTNIPNILPNGLKPIPGEHYIQCNDDYSDLIQLIQWCKNNRDECVRIGNNAKILFNNSLTPQSVNTHLKNILKI